MSVGYGQIVNEGTRALDRWREEKKALEAPGRWHEEMPAPGVVLQYPPYCISTTLYVVKTAGKAAEQHKRRKPWKVVNGISAGYVKL